MREELDVGIAVELASRFKTIPGFPWDTVEFIAGYLIDWCTGAELDGKYWTPEIQARWLVGLAGKEWDKWQSPAKLFKLFQAKFNPGPPPLKPGNAVVDWANEPCCCGSGVKFKDCCQGKPLVFDDLTIKQVAKTHRIPRRRPRSKVVSIPRRGPYVRTAAEQAELDRVAELVQRALDDRNKSA